MTSSPLHVSDKSSLDLRWYGHPVIIGALVLLVIITVMLGWGLYRDYQYTLQSAGERLQTQLRAYGSAVDIAFISAENVLHGTSLALESQPEFFSEQDHFRPLLLRSMMKSPTLGSLVLYSPKGQLVASVGRLSDQDQQVPPWVNDAIARGVHSAMGIYNGELGSLKLVYGADGEVAGALLATLESDEIKSELERGDDYGNQHLMLLDNQNRVMVVANTDEVEAELALWQDLQLSRELDDFTAFGTRLVPGQNYLFAIRQLGQQPIRAIAAISWENVLEGWKFRTFVACSSFGALILVALLLLMRWQDSLRRERKTANDLAHLHQAIEQIPSPIVITDLSSRIIYANPAYLARSGLMATQVVGQKPSIISSGQTPSATYRKLWSSLNRGVAWEGEFINRMGDGRERVEEALITPVRDTDGRVASYFAINTDVTEKREYERRLFRYREIVNASEELMALLDPDLNHIQVNSCYQRYHGRSRSEIEGQPLSAFYDEKLFSELILPRLDEALQGSSFVLEAWLEFAGLGRRFCRITANPIKGESECVESLVFNLADMTERKLSEEALQSSEERFRALSEFSPIGIFEADSGGRNIYANRYLGEMVGRTLNQLQEEGWAGFLHPDDLEYVMNGWRKLIKQQISSWQCEARMLAHEDEPRWFRCAVRRYEGASEGELRYIGMVLDITEQVKHRDALERKNAELELLSTTDNLTQLANRARIEDLLAQGVHRYERHGAGFAVIMLDIDHFKQVNDTCGHAVGDQVLRQLAELMRENTRLTDCPGRWGGEEFMIICPDTDLEGAHRLAENLRHRIEQVKFPVIGQRTCSFGVAAIRPGDQERELLKRADDALYRAKHNGRNQVVTERLPVTDKAVPE
ncbi:sensor domain-containing diguanylate cyclase [Marinobacterium sediminicola]|uniref:PAS domain S-box-containing protein/diguanylate cyclase (GGDEF) domain-containing protein n=1 Tax=Marinobacterium sediminicola TaxID=518898 RepID=A0ABY1RW59_9GAMM|nr:diguanylate cyclase [Marinobacterium sediminicola]ULG70425.1 diguanylate cyclase [Marinobacterium sediminicola]SMR69379.1 PAS domain S-box-containing protein/diguanylate cyclase (GGDEF) domain-containing protein [Marinobacterium sediminicola]